MRKRRDNNHLEIKKALQKAGYFIRDTADIGRGFPDLLSVSKSGLVILLEVKSIGEKLTPDEEKFHKIYPGRLDIVYSAEEALLTMAILDECKII